MLVALAWDSHVHHVASRHWFSERASGGWATCPVTESGFVRISANARALPSSVSVADARRVLTGFRAHPGHRFLVDDVSMVDADVPTMHGHRQVTDGHLLALARRNGMPLVTFDRGLASLCDAAADLILLSAL